MEILTNSKAALLSVWHEIKRIFFTFGIILNLSYISLAVYSLVAGRGYMPLNIAFITLSIAYFIYYILTYNDKAKKKQKKKMKKLYKLLRYFVNTVTLSFVVYGCFVTAEKVNFISLFLVVISVIGWFISGLFAIISAYVDSRIELVVTAFSVDREEPKKKIKAFINKIIGREEEAPELDEAHKRVIKNTQKYKEQEDDVIYK